MSYETMVKPTNKIVAGGKPGVVTEARVEDATNMYPGRLVKQGTDVDDVKVLDDVSGNIVGWLGYEQTAPVYRPSTIATIYVANDKAAVLKGGGFVVLASAAAGSGLTSHGITVKYASGGKVTAATAGEEAWHVGVTEDASANGNVLVRSLI